MGRRTACDIYWHGVSFHDNENIVSGQVNKFPGKSSSSPHGVMHMNSHRQGDFTNPYHINLNMQWLGIHGELFQLDLYLFVKHRNG